MELPARPPNWVYLLIKIIVKKKSFQTTLNLGLSGKYKVECLIHHFTLMSWFKFFIVFTFHFISQFLRTWLGCHGRCITLYSRTINQAQCSWILITDQSDSLDWFHCSRKPPKIYNKIYENIKHMKYGMWFEPDIDHLPLWGRLITTSKYEFCLINDIVHQI